MTDRAFLRLKDSVEDFTLAYAQAESLVLDMPGAGIKGSRSSKPHSQEPPGNDVTLQAALVRSARHLAVAHDELAKAGVSVWRTQTLGSRVETVRSEVEEREDGAVVAPRIVLEWRPAAQELDPLPSHVIRVACSQLVAAAGLLSTTGSTREIGRAHNAITRALTALEQVEQILRLDTDDDGLVVVKEWVGVAKPPDYPDDSDRCRNFPESCHRLREAGRPECAQCRRERYAQKNREAS